MKKILLLTGPQGSGNHIFSRIFSRHAQVCGWDAILNDYWVPTDEDKFAKYFVEPDSLTQEVVDSLGDFEYFVTDISYPFVYDGVKVYPKVKEFRQRLETLGFEVIVAIIVRDEWVNRAQQLRLRGEVTLDGAMTYFESLTADCYLDLEALFLHRANYLKFVSKALDFPIDIQNKDLFKYLESSPNKKYVSYVERHWLDDDVKNGLRTFADRATS